MLTKLNAYILHFILPLYKSRIVQSVQVVKSQISNIADDRSFSDNENLCSAFCGDMVVVVAKKQIYWVIVLRLR